MSKVSTQRIDKVPTPHQRLGDRVRRKRQENQLTQKQLGERIGYDQSVISRFENGEDKLDAIAVFSVAREFNCSVEEFNPFVDILCDLKDADS